MGRREGALDPLKERRSSMPLQIRHSTSVAAPFPSLNVRRQGCLNSVGIRHIIRRSLHFFRRTCSAGEKGSRSTEGSFAAIKSLEEGQNQPKIGQKRIQFKEIIENGEEDRISKLPDCLLLEILSRLPSTTEAIRTGTLSKRWKHVWTLVPSLIFKTSGYGRSLSNFPLDIDKTLNQCRQLKLKKFKVNVVYYRGFESLFKNWIRYAISCNVEDLNLEILMGMTDESLLDHSFFINSCFVNLRLSCCKMNPTGTISWKNLRSLHLSKIHLNEDLVINILSGSPLLETLEFFFCLSNDSDDEANSSKLTQCPQLKLKQFKVTTNGRFKSHVNNWVRYVIRCNVVELNLQFPWDVAFRSEFISDQILFTTPCFTHLTLQRCMLNPVGAINWKNLRRLCLSGYRRLDEDLIENILCGSPVLETLVLDDCCGYRRLDITSKSVKNLVLSGYNGSGDESEADVIEINAPYILTLKFKDGILLWKPLLLNVSSSVKAELDYYYMKPMQPVTLYNEEAQEMLKGFIQNLGHVKEVQIGSRCSKVSSYLQAKGFIFPSNVKLTGVK